MGMTPPDVAMRQRDANRKALPKHAREHNRSLIMRTLYQGGPQSRADLARATGLAKVTVSDLVMELLQAGLLQELGTRTTKGPGKPAVILDLAWDAFLIVAVDLSEHDVIRAALLTMDAQRVEEELIPWNSARGKKALKLVISSIRALLRRADRPVLGIGVGAPGIITEDGAVKYAPNLDWQDVPLQDIIEDAFDVPTRVVNDTNLAAVGEQLYGQGADDFLLIKVGQGIGAGLILGGELVTGARHTVGEIGHLIVEEDSPPGGEYSADHILERWLAVPDLRKRLEAPEGEAEDVLRASGRRLGSALVPIVSALDLTEVVLQGPEDLLDGPFSDEAMRIIRQRTLPQTHENLQIRLSSEGPRLVLLGCAAQVLSTFLGTTRGTQANK